MRKWVYAFHHKNNILEIDNYSNGKQQHQGLAFEQRMKLISFTNEIETDGLGVSCKFFTITYSSCGSVSITLLAFHNNIDPCLNIFSQNNCINRLLD